MPTTDPFRTSLLPRCFLLAPRKGFHVAFHRNVARRARVGLTDAFGSFVIVVLLGAVGLAIGMTVDGMIELPALAGPSRANQRARPRQPETLHRAAPWGPI